MVDHAELLQRLGETPALARALDPRDVGDAVGDGAGWSASVVLGHLAYVDQHVWLPRLHEMAERDLPEWEWWEPDGVDWAGLYGARTYADVADEFDLARNGTLSYLGGLTEAGWSRRARHTVFGELAVAGLCEEILAHDNDHLGQLRAH